MPLVGEQSDWDHPEDNQLPVENTNQPGGWRPKGYNQYRRSFDWRVSAGSSETRRPHINAMVHLASSDFPDILEDYLDISRRRTRNHTALAKLQIHLLEELMFQEQAVKHYKKRLSKLQADSGNADEEHKRAVRFCGEEIFFYRLYANAIRALGDGIAWRALGYDRAVTRLMSQCATKQTLLAEGTVEELRQWSLQFDTGTGMAILNSLTNCFAVGDITIVKLDGGVEIVEVKTSNTNSSRKVRQKQRMSEIVTLLDQGTGQSGGKEVNIEILPLTPESGLSEIGELLAIAGEKGWASKRISNCLFVEAFDFGNIDSWDEVKPTVESARSDALRDWERRGDSIINLNTLDCLAFSPNCAPFSVFPFDNRTCIELLIGAKSYVTYLNLNAVSREFEYRGWHIDKSAEEAVKNGDQEALLTVSKGPFYACVPPGDFMRLQIEALRPKTLSDALHIKSQRIPNKTIEGHTLAIYEGESDLWR